MFDTITILLEGDARGLTSTFRSATEKVTGFVSKLNSQQIDWKRIMAGTLDTAVIAGVAASFATAITQAVEFQNSLMNVSNNVSPAAGGQMGQLSGQIAGLAGTTGASLSSTAGAFFALQKQFGSTAAAQKLTGMAGELALVSNQKLSALMPALINLFNQWGVTTLPQAKQALTGLINEAGKGKFTLDELIQMISANGASLQGSTTITKMAIGLQTLSNNAKLSKTSIQNAFGAISNGVADPMSKINILSQALGNGGLKKVISGPGGLVAAFESVTTAEKKFGIVGVNQAAQWGLSLATAKQLQGATAKSYTASEIAAKKAIKQMQSFNTIVQQNLSVTDKLSQAWGGLTAELVTKIGGPILNNLGNLLKDVQDITKGTITWKDFFTSLPTGFSDVSKTLFKDVFQAEAGLVKGGINMGGGLLKALGILPSATAPSPAPIPSQSATPSNSGSQTNIHTTVNINGGNEMGSNPLLFGNSISKHLALHAQGLQG